MMCKKIIAIVCFVCAFTYVDVSSVCAQNLPKEIEQALKKGDAKSLSKYFNNSVELIFSQSQGVYGKAQAEQIMKVFFTNNTVNNQTEFEYKLLHKFNKENTVYIYIGQLYTGRGTYRVSIYVKKQFIHQIRIDND